MYFSNKYLFIYIFNIQWNTTRSNRKPYRRLVGKWLIYRLDSTLISPPVSIVTRTFPYTHIYIVHYLLTEWLYGEAKKNVNHADIIGYRKVLNTSAEIIFWNKYYRKFMVKRFFHVQKKMCKKHTRIVLFKLNILRSLVVSIQSVLYWKTICNVPFFHPSTVFIYIFFHW